jgi:beta-glucuronidase
MNKSFPLLLCLCMAGFYQTRIKAQSILSNIEGRDFQNLDGKWEMIIDPFNAGAGNWKPVWKDQQPAGKNDFYEYQFNKANTLNVPGDWNSQQQELLYYEGTIWYKKVFRFQPKEDRKVFIYFGAVNYLADVYLNNEKIGSHEGGFTPFQFEITGKIREGENTIIVRVNNQRREDAIPSLNFDWWNYGGITRDVYIAETPLTYILDYFIQLSRGDPAHIEGWVQLAGISPAQKISISIPELKINYQTQSNAEGRANVLIHAKPVLWNPENPKLYDVFIRAGNDSIRELIGFRTIEVKGFDILLNGKPVFLRGINIHEEIPQRAGRAYSETDDRMLLGWAKELGCNFVRLTHYPHNEHMIRLADRMGILVWEEIPLWQGIAFTNPLILKKANILLDEMIGRDKNRSSIIIWSLSNETAPSEKRDQTLVAMAARAKTLDPTRLVSSAFNHVSFDKNRVTIDDTVSRSLDLIGVNEYLGWYMQWPAKPGEMEWKSPFGKPLIMTEFGAEALYGNHGPADTASSWSEEFQEKVFKDQLEMLKKIPFLRGMTPWILADFRSPGRMHPIYQQGWNRKGILSDKGQKKKAWYILHDYYEQLQNSPADP